MRCVTAVLSLTVVVVMTAASYGQTGPSFAGEWKLKVGQSPRA